MCMIFTEADLKETKRYYLLKKKILHIHIHLFL